MLFNAQTPLGFRVHITRSYWEFIVTFKHPVMMGRGKDAEQVLRFPEEIRRSRSDPAVHLFYRSENTGRWICVVVKRLDGEGFIITTYPTDSIKEGERVWNR